MSYLLSLSKRTLNPFPELVEGQLFITTLRQAQGTPSRLKLRERVQGTPLEHCDEPNKPRYTAIYLQILPVCHLMLAFLLFTQLLSS